MQEVSLPRLYALRALYLLMVVGLGLVIWPRVLGHDAPSSVMAGVVQCMLAAYSLMCLLGLRYPLQMLPVLIWEMAWKLLWLGMIAYPLWAAGKMDPSTLQTVIDCSWLVIFPFIIPWPYVMARFVRQDSERWR